MSGPPPWLMLKRAPIGWNQEDYDVLQDGLVVERILKVPIAPQDQPRMWTSGRNGEAYFTSSYPDYVDIKSHNNVFTDVIGYTPAMAALLPSLINPLKLATEAGAVVVAVLDVVMGLAVAIMGFVEVASSA